jgi:hypothetical protein
VPAPSAEPPAADHDATTALPTDSGAPPDDGSPLPTVDTSAVLDDGPASPGDISITTIPDDSSVAPLPDGVTIGPLPDEVNTITTTGDNTIATVTDATPAPLPDGVTIGPLPDEVSTITTTGDGSITTITDDISIAPLPDDAGLAALDNATGDGSITTITDDISIAPLPDAIPTPDDAGLAALGNTIQDATDGGGLASLGDALATATDDAPLAAVGNTVQDATDDGGLASLGDTLASATDDAPLAAVANTIQDATDDGGLASLGDTLGSTTDDSSVAGLGNAITDDSGLVSLGSLTHSVGGAADAAGLDAVTGGLTDGASALVTTVESSVMPQVSGSALQIASPLTTTVDSFDASVGDTVAAVTAPFAVTVPSIDPQRSPAVTGDGAATTPGGDTSPDGSVTPGTHTLVDGAAVSAAPVTTMPGADQLLNPEPLFGPALPAAADPVMRLDPGSPTALSGPAIDQSPGSIADAPGLLVGPAAHGPSVIPDPGMADALSPTDSALAAIADVAPDARVLVSAAVLAMAAAAMVGPRASGSGADLKMVFTNVRLLPCVVKESLARHVEMLTAATTAGGGPGPAGAYAASLAPASGTRGASAEGASGAAERVRDAFERALGSFRDGFEQAIAGERQDVGDDLRDSRLMLQIGMLLGFVYVGFLSIWFWATRLRETDRPDAT